MTIKRHRIRPLASRSLLLAACALLLLGGAGTASAQLPATTPTLIFSDDFTSAWTEPPGPAGWTGFNYDRDDSDPGDWEVYTTPRSCSQLRWIPYMIVENDSDQPAGGDGQHALVVTETLAGGLIPNADKTNIRLEFDFQGSDEFRSRPGAVWNLTENSGDGDDVIDDGYFFWFTDLPDRSNTPAQKSNWELVKKVGGVPTVVASGVVDATADPTWQQYYTVAEDMCYRLRVDYYCGYIRVQVKQFYCTSPSSCSIDSDWLTLVEWVDDFATYGPTLAPGGIGFFSGSDNTSEPSNFYDNFDLWTWGEACTSTEACGEWSAWGEVNRENLRFKRLYEGAVKDYSLGDVDPEFRIDINTSSPDPADADTFCNGWKLLVDLPEPIITSDLDEVRHFLQSTSTAVEFLSDGAGTFEFLDHFDEDPLSGTYNPVPMVADGKTPIANSLLDAFDWYVDQREAGGRWEFDPLAECRKWYVVLITDGAESCSASTRPDGTGGGFACDSGKAADKFANPGVAGVDPIPVFTIGFSETVAAAPPQLTCISDITDGQYFGARNASELKDALYGVLNQLNTDEERSFTPFKVSPPPSSKGGPATEQDFLVVYPYFQAIKESSLWSGNLFGFRLNESQTTLATDANCEVDATTLVVEEVDNVTWDAAARLTDQLGAATPVRPVLMGQLASGAWTRHDLTEIPTDATLRLYLRNHMMVPGGVNDIEAQEVVNFLRNIWVDNDTSVTPDPRDADPSTGAMDARPAGYPVLGDFYHSQPLVVSPPNRSMFFFDYGYGDANGYASFMEKHAMRRRVVLAGANDGLLHAFDGGIFDRDRSSTTETYNDQHDLGSGQELFAYVPHAVMPRLFNMTYGKSQQYTVDGLIAASDVYIDHDGDTNREWRTVAIATMRRGGRGMVALDITQPDPINGTTFVPDVPTDQFPGCLDTGTGCVDEYPKVLWEFKDVDDTDSNCPYAPPTSIQCSPYWDLGWTWSKPAIARIAINDDPNPPDDVFVAFFGGGWDRTESDRTGNYIYGVDIATGNILYEANIGVAVPGSPTALDSDIDGFHDRIYFADSNGGIHRLQFPSPDDAASTGADAGTLTRIFDFRATFGTGGFTDRQRFFTRPVMVPALFGGSGYTWAMALGTGDRANLDRYDDVNDPVDHFFFMLDVGDATTRGRADLVAVNYDELNGDFDCTATDSPLDPAVGNYGWYLSLRPNEKVVFDASVINGHVLFPTFDPTPGEFASHNVPDECVPTAGGTPTPTATPNVAFGGEEVICKAAGVGRSYDLWFECGLGEYGENNDIYTGIEDYTIGGTTYVTFTESSFTEGETEEFPNVTGHVVTNWRQD